MLDRLTPSVGRPEWIAVDNGPEFSGQVLAQWALENGVRLHFITPGKPNENAYVESFNGESRNEWLNENWFGSPAEACGVDYNRARPHSALGYRTREEFAAEQAALPLPPCDARTQ